MSTYGYFAVLYDGGCLQVDGGSYDGPLLTQHQVQHPPKRVLAELRCLPHDFSRAVRERFDCPSSGSGLAF